MNLLAKLNYGETLCITKKDNHIELSLEKDHYRTYKTVDIDDLAESRADIILEYVVDILIRELREHEQI